MTTSNNHRADQRGSTRPLKNHIGWVKLKLLFTLILLLCMSTFASSNECARDCRDTGNKSNKGNAGKIMNLPASSAASSLVTDRDKAATTANTKTTSEDNGSAGEDKAYALTLIKLLYI